MVGTAGTRESWAAGREARAGEERHAGATGRRAKGSRLYLVDNREPNTGITCISLVGTLTWPPHPSQHGSNQFQDIRRLNSAAGCPRPQPPSGDTPISAPPSQEPPDLGRQVLGQPGRGEIPSLGTWKPRDPGFHHGLPFPCWVALCKRLFVAQRTSSGPPMVSSGPAGSRPASPGEREQQEAPGRKALRKPPHPQTAWAPATAEKAGPRAPSAASATPFKWVRMGNRSLETPGASRLSREDRLPKVLKKEQRCRWCPGEHRDSAGSGTVPF